MAYGDRIEFRPLDLEAIDERLYEPKYEELTARQCFGIKNDIPAGAETFAYNVMTRTGVAKIMANAADDLPLVDVDFRREFIRIYTIAVGFTYSLQEMRAAQMPGTTLKSVDASKADVARRAAAELENKITWLGEPNYNIKGATNATGIQTWAVPNGASNDTKWVNKTSFEIIEDIRKLRKLVAKLPGHSTSGNLCLCLPPDQYEEINRRYSDYDARSIHQVLDGYDWFSDIHRVPDLAGSGTSGSDCMLIMDTSVDVVQMILPMDLTRLQPEWSYPRWKVPAEERYGGLIIRYPMGFARGDGI